MGVTVKYRLTDFSARMKRIERSAKDIALQEVYKIGEEARQYLVRATRDFSVEKRPLFTLNKAVVNGVKIVANNERVFQILDEGSKSHFIPAPGPHTPLVFPTAGNKSYIAMTIVNSFDSRGAPAFRGMVYTQVQYGGVNHPGTKPRNWSKKLATMYAPDKVSKRVQRALDSGMEAMGL